MYAYHRELFTLTLRKAVPWFKRPISKFTDLKKNQKTTKSYFWFHLIDSFISCRNTSKLVLGAPLYANIIHNFDGHMVKKKKINK